MNAWDKWVTNGLRLTMMMPRILRLSPMLAARQFETIHQTMKLNQLRLCGGITPSAERQNQIRQPDGEVPSKAVVIPFPGDCAEPGVKSNDRKQDSALNCPSVAAE